MIKPKKEIPRGYVLIYVNHLERLVKSVSGTLDDYKHIMETKEVFWLKQSLKAAQKALDSFKTKERL